MSDRSAPAQPPASTRAPWSGGAATERAHCILAPNPGPMTLDGTNTWVLLEPGSTDAVVIDPGPLDEGHLRAVLDHVAARGARVALTVLTHGHLDHSEAGPRFAELTGAPVRAVGTGHDDLGDGSVLTGDTVLGRGTTVVAHPDGELEAYLGSLDRIRRLTGSGEVVTILPGHGPVVPDAAAMVDFYRMHRRERLEQVRAALAAGDRTAREVVERVYADVPREVWPAAELSVEAQLAYLRDR